MDFFDVFCLLVDMTGSTLSDIARSIAYDRSYVSKWYNRKEVPFSDSWDDIAGRLVAYFVPLLQEKHYVRLIEDHPRIKEARKFYPDRLVLRSLLDDAYKLHFQRQDQEDSIPPGTAQMFSGSEAIIQALVRTFDRLATTEKKCYQGYFKGDALDAIYPELLDNLIINYTSNVDWNFHFAMNCEGVDPEGPESFNRLQLFFRLNSAYSFMTWRPYASGTIPETKIWLEGDLAGYGTQISKGPEFKFFSFKDQALASTVHRELLDYFQTSKPLVVKEKDLDFLTSDSSHEPQKDPLFYHYYLPVSWAGEDFLDQLWQEGLLNDAHYRACKAMCQIFSQPPLSEANHLVVNRGYKEAYEQGWVNICGDILQLKGRLLENYLDRASQQIAQFKASGNWTTISDRVPNLHRLPKMSIYSDQARSFYACYKCQDGEFASIPIYRFESPLSQHVYHYLSNIKLLEPWSFIL